MEKTITPPTEEEKIESLTKTLNQTRQMLCQAQMQLLQYQMQELKAEEESFKSAS